MIFNLDEFTDAKNIDEFPWYWVTPEGIVLTRIMLGLAPMLPHGKVRKMNTGKTRYPKVVLRNAERKRWAFVHELVLQAFVGPRPPECKHVRHLDGNHKNNRLQNVAWGTVQENVDDRIRHGRQEHGENHHGSKLTEKYVIEIREMARKGIKTSKIAKSFGISFSHTKNIIDGNYWKHLLPELERTSHDNSSSTKATAATTTESSAAACTDVPNERPERYAEQ